MFESILEQDKYTRRNMAQKDDTLKKFLNMPLHKHTLVHFDVE